MAVIFTEGFDYYNGGGGSTTTTVGIRSRWFGGIVNAVAGRFGGQAMEVTDPNNPLNALMPSTYTSGCLGFAINVAAGYDGTAYGIAAVSTVGAESNLLSAAPQFSININTAGRIQVYRGSTLLGVSTAAITFSAWNYIEVEFVISATVGEVRVYLNNDPTPVVNLSGVNNKARADSGFSVIIFDSTSSANSNYDDVYVTDTPTRLGEQRVITSYVNGDVSSDFWASSTGGAAPFTMLDETVCDADVTYVSSNTFNSRIVLTVPSLPVPPTTVNAVQIVGFARKTDTEFRQVALEYQNTAGAVSTGASYALNATYTYTNNLMIQNPLTAAPWTATDVNSMKIGARLT